ncbi:MAG: YcxB family protein [Cyanobacteria bacterium P01_A01_bin.116]
MHQALLRYDEALVRRAVFAFWKRTVGYGFPIALGLVAVGFVPDLIRGTASWVTGVCATVFVLGVGLVVTIYAVHIKNSMAKFRALGQPEARFIAEDETFTLVSDVGSSTLNWSAIQEVWRFSEFWLVLFSKAQFSIIPLAGVSHQMQVFVLDKVRGSGGKVIAVKKP